MTQAPATPSLVESDDWALEIAACGFANDSTLPDNVRSFIKDLWRAYCAMEERAAALEAQQARIAELEKALTWIALFAETRVRDSDRTFAKVARGAVQTIAEHSRQALSSQGRREGEQDSSSRSQPCGVGPSDLTDPQSQHSDGGRDA